MHSVQRDRSVCTIIIIETVMFATSVTVCVVCEYVRMWICTQMLRCSHESMHMGKDVS